VTRGISFFPNNVIRLHPVQLCMDGVSGSGGGESGAGRRRAVTDGGTVSRVVGRREDGLPEDRILNYTAHG
jgi:hypothetical protein